MILPKLFLKRFCLKKQFSNRYYSTSDKHPANRTWNVLSKEIPVLFGGQKEIVYPEHTDIVIIGGGFIGSAVAYWLKTRATHGLSVVVLEKDLNYQNTPPDIVSLSTITQHFSLPENIYLAKHSAEFLRNIKKNLEIDVDLKYTPTGSLILASEKYAELMEKNVVLQKEHGLRSELLSPKQIQQRYPWINTEDISLGCTTYESEGIFNSWALLKGLKDRAEQLGAIYINAEVTGFELEQQRDVLMEGVPPGSFKRIIRVKYKTPDNEERKIKFAACILAAGDKSAEISKLANVGTGEGLLSIPLPIEKREFNVYSLEEKASETGLNTPLVMDTSGVWVRRNVLENNLLFGQLPFLSTDLNDLSESEYYDMVIQPSLLNRYPSFKDGKPKKLTREMNDCNIYDDTGILGPHAYHNNLYIAAGFGKLGCQHAPGIGRAIAELIIDSHYATIDLTRFGFDRLITSQPLVEFNIY